MHLFASIIKTAVGIPSNAKCRMMSSLSPRSQAQRESRIEKRTSKVNKACVPCRARKVKCDAGVVGLPCSNCTSRKCVADCVPLVRKTRTRKPLDGSSTLDQPGAQSHDDGSSGDLDGQLNHEAEPDLLYLRILNDTVKETPGANVRTESNDLGHSKQKDPSTKLQQLNEIDRDYLDKKGVFKVPPQHALDALIKTYLELVHPLIPVINQSDFMQRYHRGEHSLLLLYAMLTTASIPAAADVLSACGFDSPSDAQKSFFLKARLLYDFIANEDILTTLQVSIILCLVILDHPTDRDFGFWLHNAVGIATKLNLRGLVSESNKHLKDLKLYRRIWWSLYVSQSLMLPPMELRIQISDIILTKGSKSLDTFHVFVNPRRQHLFGNGLDLQPLTDNDLEDRYIHEDMPQLILAATLQREAMPIIQCEMSRLFNECLSVFKSRPQQDPRQMLQHVDNWRRSLASKMHIDENAGTDILYLSTQAMSYRFECILCRHMHRVWKSIGCTEFGEWAKQRYRSAILEMEAIVMRATASGSLGSSPTPFVTTITTLLALQIESVLDVGETQLIRSMSRNSISQTMLVLTQARSIPAIKRALPIFEELLAKYSLYRVQPDNLGLLTHQAPGQPSAQQPNTMVNASTSASLQAVGLPPRLEQQESNLSWDVGFLGLETFEEWQQLGWLDFA